VFLNEFVPSTSPTIAQVGIGRKPAARICCSTGTMAGTHGVAEKLNDRGIFRLAQKPGGSFGIAPKQRDRAVRSFREAVKRFRAG